MRPARSYADTTPSTPISPLVRPTGPFVAQVLGQFGGRDTVDPRHAARSYAAADALNYLDLSLAVASL